MLPHLKTISQWRREQTGSSRRSNECERLEVHAERPRIDPLAEYDIDTKIFHCRIEKFLDRLGKAVNLINKQNRPFLGIGQIRDQILGCCQCGPTGDLKIDAKIPRDTGRKRSLSESRRAVKKNVAERLGALCGGIYRDFNPLIHLPLPDHVGHMLRAQVAVIVRRNFIFRTRRSVIIRRKITLQNRLTGHENHRRKSSNSRNAQAGVYQNRRMIRTADLR